MLLYKNYPLEVVQTLADYRRERLHGKKVFYNRNIHIEPTNKCVYACKFCSFYRSPKSSSEEGVWDYTFEDIEEILESHKTQNLTEVHITGGVHPTHELDWWTELVRRVKKILPGIHVKAYTAVEIAFMAKQEGISFKQVLLELQKAGVDSLPGGGAEILNSEVRKKIAGGKAPSSHWLEIHKTAHELRIQSNATMLYGHVETLEHRLEHMIEIRELQEQTDGFNAFIPLKYRNVNNALSHIKETQEEDDLRNFAVSRLMVQNIKHLKAYWVMLGIETAQKSLSYGVDDLDGTISDTTKIYSMAGSIDHPAMTVMQLKQIIENQDFIPVERDSIYNPI
ncbi:MAG: CofH family radical SAM protein [SAR324 cluster bacterium]|nr:CofH family radical SAM protein [SAR324 cluster bacterium]